MKCLARTIKLQSVLLVSIAVLFVFSSGGTLFAQSQTPYSGTPMTIPGIIPFYNYDNGGEGVAYHDTTSGNICNPPAYRFEDVDIQECSYQYSDYNVGYIATGEWLEYTVNINYSDYYDVYISVAGPSGGAFHLEVNGSNFTGSRHFAATGGSQSWDTIIIPSVWLWSGQKVIRFYAEQSNFNVAKMSFYRTNITPYGGTARSLPGTIQAEDYDSGGSIYGYSDTTSGNVCYYAAYRYEDVDVENNPASGSTINVGYIANYEWLHYTVNVQNSGYYYLDVRAAAPDGGMFTIYLDYENQGAFSIAASNQDNQTYATSRYGPFYLAKGLQRIKIFFLIGDWNFDSFSFVSN